MATPLHVRHPFGPTLSSDTSKGRILLVDDERGLLDLYAEVLVEDGYEVVCASDGRAAQQALRDGPFDAVFTDIVMRGGNGIDVLRAAGQTDPQLPVVLLTGNPSVDSAVQAVELRAVHYLIKPIGIDELLRCASQMVQLRRQRGAISTDSSSAARGGEDDEGAGALERLFTRAVEGLQMAYQPMVHARDGSLFAWEALLRTRVPELASPPEFVALAERLGQLPRLGRAIRDRVARTMSGAAGVVFVNLHPDDLLDEHLYDAASPLSRFATDVVLEITERSPIERIPDVGDRTRRLRALGFRLAVDDLGSGSAGLTSCALVKPEFVKIDRALVAGMDRDPTRLKLVGTIVSVARDLAIRVIAEGIERDEEKDAAVATGCDLLQGYLFGRPTTGSPRSRPGCRSSVPQAAVS